MKKYLLLCAIGIALGTSVSLAANVAKTEKTAVIVDTGPELSINDLVNSFDFKGLESFDVVVFINADRFYSPKTELIELPVFITPAPLIAEPDRPGDNIEYKQKGQLKAKYHSWYLFNPVKIC